MTELNWTFPYASQRMPVLAKNIVSPSMVREGPLSLAAVFSSSTGVGALKGTDVDGRSARHRS